MLFLVLFARHETTTHLIGGSICELLKNPGLRDWLRAAAAGNGRILSLPIPGGRHDGSFEMAAKNGADSVRQLRT